MYDFGDSWKHTILVKKFLPRDALASYPLCTGGERHAPPEDCGGVGGFYNLLDILADEQNPEREEWLEWVDGSFDPEFFDPDTVNLEMQKVKQYVKEWLDDTE